MLHSLQEIKVEYAQRLESGARGEMGGSKSTHHQGPKVIRGGHRQQEGTEKPVSPTINKSVRGRGRKEETDSDVADIKEDVKHDDTSSNNKESSSS